MHFPYLSFAFLLVTWEYFTGFFRRKIALSYRLKVFCSWRYLWFSLSLCSRHRLVYGSPMRFVFHRLVLLVFPGSFRGLLHYNPLPPDHDHRSSKKNNNKKMVTVRRVCSVCFCSEISVWFRRINRTDHLRLMMYTPSYPMTWSSTNHGRHSTSLVMTRSKRTFPLRSLLASSSCLPIHCYCCCCFYDYYYYYYCSRH